MSIDNRRMWQELGMDLEQHGLPGNIPLSEEPPQYGFYRFDRR
jgi:hypothetical protein